MKRRDLIIGGLLAFGYAHVALWVSMTKRRSNHPLPSMPVPLPRRPLCLSTHVSTDPSDQDEDVCSIAFSLLGGSLFSASVNDQLALWDPGTQRRVSTWSGPPQQGFSDVGFCSDNSWIATISPYRGIKFWTPGKTRDTEETSFKEVTYNEYHFHPTCVAFKPLTVDSANKSPSIVAVALGDNSIRILEFDPQSQSIPADVLALRTNDPRAVKIPELFQESTSLKGHAEQINAMCFSRDGTLLASASGDRTIRIWDTTNWQQTAVLENHFGGVNSVSFSEDGSRLVSASDDRSIIVWDRQTMLPTRIFMGHAGPVLNAVFCGNSDWLVSTSVDRRILVWSLTSSSNEPFELALNPGNYAAISVSADGDYLASAWKREVRFWRTSGIRSEAERQLKPS